MRPSSDIPPIAPVVAGLLGLLVGAALTPAAGAVTVLLVIATVAAATRRLLPPVPVPVPVRARAQAARRPGA